MREYMQIFSWNDILAVSAGQRPVPEIFARGTAMTIGSFDGSHLGHRKLYSLVLERAGASHGVVTFTRSLRGYKYPDSYPGDIASLRQRLALLDKCGFDFVILIDFSAEFARMEGHVFLGMLAQHCGLSFLAEGKDFRCGYKGACGLEQVHLLGADMGFEYAVPDSVFYKGEKISSSRIRACIDAGDFESVEYMLGYPFAYDCMGIEWQADGTARRKPVQLLPAPGRYNVKVLLTDGTSYPAELSFGSDNLRLMGSQCGTQGSVESIVFISKK